jgi:hypothetical protein
MSTIQGSIPVTGFIGPTDSLDTYAVTDAIYGIDGYRSVSGTTARNDITTERRREGMLVYTQDDKNVWQLLPAPWSGINDDWKIFISSAATNSLTATTSFLSLSGGTVSGDTFFNTNLSAGTLNVTNGMIMSAGTDLYNIFSTGTGVVGNFLSISGGTVTGDTMFTTNVSANTLALTTTNTAAPLNFPVFIADPASPNNGDAWIVSGATGNALFNVRIGGVTKTVELT